MIEAIIRWSIHNRIIVLLGALSLLIGGLNALRTLPIDAIPDLTDVQVIIKTQYAGQAPQVVEDQITYPLTTAMLSVPGARDVRGFSFFGDSYVYVIFDDQTDPYWARSRVLEYLSQVRADLPASAEPELGPDASGVGWVFSYALVDRSGRHDLAQLRSLQDWFLKFELQSIAGVAEVATLGGMVRQYQVVLDPNRLRGYGLTVAGVADAILAANQETGASVIELAEAEYVVRSTGYLDSLNTLANTPVGVKADAVPIVLQDVAEVRLGAQMRRVVTDLNGEGEAVGGVVVMRDGGNARRLIAQVEARLDELRRSLPDGVEVLTTYNRATLIENAVDNLLHTLVEEFIIIVLVCALFLFHFRSSLVIMISLPLGILAAVWIMQQQGISANIMSLGGIAIAIGDMVDCAIVMVENLHKKLEQADSNADHWPLVTEAASEVGRPLFYSLLITTLSFLPVLALEAQEGKLFAPLAYTKTYALAAAAGLAITLTPVLMGYLIRGGVRAEMANPVNRWFERLYQPYIRTVLHWPKTTLALALVLLVSTAWPLSRLGSEFMPPLDEGDVFYMPTTYAGISIGKAREILHKTHRLIKTVPEVDTVYGKAGRGDTATDPAPLTMIESFVQLKPQSAWRPGMTKAQLLEELSALIQFPGVTNAWLNPIKTRIDMLSTGIRTPVGVRILGPDMPTIERLGRDLETLLNQVPGTASAYAERVAGGRYLTVDIDRFKAASLGVTLAQVQQVLATAVGGVNLTETVEGRERYPVNLRYPQRYRDSLQRLQELPLVLAEGRVISLQDVANVRIESGPPAIRSENARLTGLVFIDIQGVPLGAYVARAQQTVAQGLTLPPGYSLEWAGQFEHLQRAQQRLLTLAPLAFLVITILLYLAFQRFTEVVMILLTIPFGLIGGIWLLHALQYSVSVAVAVGFIALAGIVVEIGIILLMYMNQRWQQVLQQPKAVPTRAALRAAIIEGAGGRIRPVMITVLTVVLGLIPAMVGDGTGHEVMQRIAAPMVGGMISALLLTLLLLPALFYLVRGRGLAS